MCLTPPNSRTNWGGLPSQSATVRRSSPTGRLAGSLSSCFSGFWPCGRCMEDVIESGGWHPLQECMRQEAAYAMLLLTCWAGSCTLTVSSKPWYAERWALGEGMRRPCTQRQHAQERVLGWPIG